MKLKAIIAFCAFIFTLNASAQEVIIPVGHHKFTIDSTDNLGTWPSPGDSAWGMDLPDKFTGNEIHGYMLIDSIEGTGQVLDGWTLKGRRAKSTRRADSLQTSAGAGHSYRYAKVINGAASVDFNDLTLTDSVWVEIKFELDGIRPRAIEWVLSHKTANNDDNTDDSAAVNLYIDGFVK